MKLHIGDLVIVFPRTLWSPTMSRLTITLDDSMHQALKEAAARQGRSIGKIIEEGLVLRGIKPMESARQLVARARRNAARDDDEALNIAVKETHAARKK